ncbi:hypothetical protein [Pseudolysinimonas yzui]|uniref:Uncharacterized protein n=1 Tax=Pseudolysinimonas yzui TaxID=2708254 RepID=A0A8J3GQ40_9MICO|nr:hypothetical protein [Pseudolysinimonas yzui]GHF14625.1 hypothetical protein GCM10011600_14460 [Pseudolysinimonas yzui]
MIRRSVAVWTADTFARLVRAGGRRPIPRTWAHLVVTGPLPLVAMVAGQAVVTTCFISPRTVSDRYGMLTRALVPSDVLLVVGVGLAAALMTVLVAHLAIRSRTTVAQKVMQVAAVSALGLAVPLLDQVATASIVAAVGFIAWSIWPRVALYLGLGERAAFSLDSDHAGKLAPSHGKEVMRMFDHLEFGRSWAPYVCRGCGTEISYKDRFLKCPVCGIKFN